MAAPTRSLVLVVLLLGGSFALFLALSGSEEDRSRAELGPRAEAAREEGPRGPLAPPREVESEVSESSDGEVDRVRRVHGRVVDHDRGEPIGGVAVIVEEGTLRARARSDEEGRFELDWRGGDGARGVALPKKGWVPTGPPVPLSPAHLAGTEELVLTLRPGTADVVFGRVLDPTGQGVFDARVSLDMPRYGLSDSVVTEGDGSFRSEVSFPEGELVGDVADLPPGEEPVLVHRFEVDHLEGGRLRALTLDVPIGPTFLVAASIGTVLDESFRARVRAAVDETGIAAVLGVEDSGFRLLSPPGAQIGREVERDLLGGLGYTGAEDADRVDARTPDPEPWTEVALRTRLSDGSQATPWVRYARAIAPPVEGVAYELVLSSRDTWYGAGPLARIEGLHPGVVSVVLDLVARVGGRVVDTTGAGVPEARVQLHEPGKEDEAPLFLTTTNRAGSFELERVPAGSWVVRIVPRKHAGSRFPVDLPPGRVALQDTVLPAAPNAGSVEGRLYVQDGIPHDSPVLTLASNEGSAWHALARAHRNGRNESGELVYTFRFDDVPSGEYELTVGALGWRDATRGNAWSPPAHKVFPPRDGVLFHCRASEEPLEFRFDVLGPDDRPLRGAEVTFGPGGWLSGSFDLDWTRTFRVPRDASLSWSVHAPHHRPVSGTEADIRHEEGGGVIELRPSPGWGATLYLVAASFDREARALDALQAGWMTNPVVGAKAYADGRLLGRSDARGRLELAGDQRPERIVLRAEGWVAKQLSRPDRRRGGLMSATVVLLVRKE